MHDDDYDDDDDDDIFCRSLWVTLGIANTKHTASQDDLTDGLLNLGKTWGVTATKLHIRITIVLPFPFQNSEQQIV